MKETRPVLSTTAAAYIHSRGWTKEDYTEVGAFSDGDMVYFPVSAYDGSWIGDVGRNMKKKQYIIRLRCSKWGYFLWKGMEDRVLFLVEGPFDLGWLLAEGFHAAAYLSDTLNAGQIRVIKRFYKRVVFIPDNDTPGRRGSDAAGRKLKDMGVTVRSFKMDMYKDVDELFRTDSKQANTFVNVLRKIESELTEGDEES